MAIISCFFRPDLPPEVTPPPGITVMKKMVICIKKYDTDLKYKCYDKNNIIDTKLWPVKGIHSRK